MTQHLLGRKKLIKRIHRRGSCHFFAQKNSGKTAGTHGPQLVIIMFSGNLSAIDTYTYRWRAYKGDCHVRKILIGLVLALSLAGVQAAVVTVPGTDVEFTYDTSSLFGIGTVVGNSIFFSPTTFKAESLNLDGTDSVGETLIIDVVATTPGYQLTEFALVELGDYLLTGSSSSVTAAGRLQVTSATKTCGILPCTDWDIFNVAGMTTIGSLTGWSGNVGIDFADTAGWISDTSVEASIQNDLTATSTVNGESAMVEKKFQGVGLVVNPIPVPAAVWLFGSALGLLSWLRRRAT